MNCQGSTTKETEPCRYSRCPHSTAKSTIPSHGHTTTIAQTPKVNHQHITWAWRCTSHPASQGLWRPECGSTIGQWRSQRSSTPKGYFWLSKMVHGGNCIHKEFLANHNGWEVLDGWWNLETSHWSPGPSAGIGRCSCRCTICVSIARWSIS